jgi:CheY-like chemotaxis protein
MVVDDEVDIAMIVQKYLEKWGFSVETFTNPLHALDKFRENPDAYSLALLDIRMPEMTGFRLASMLQEVKPDMKVVIMTAYEVASDELRTHLPTITHQDILQKPFKLVQVCNAVKKQLTAK